MKKTLSVVVLLLFMAVFSVQAQKFSFIEFFSTRHPNNIDEMSPVAYSVGYATNSVPFGYVDIEDILAWQIDSGWIGICAKVPNYNIKRARSQSFKDELAMYYSCASSKQSEKYRIYQEMNIRHGDTLNDIGEAIGFDEDVYSREYMSNIYPLIDIIEIVVTSDKRFDARHPAGKPLNDIALFRSANPIPYIKSGYIYPDIKDERGIGRKTNMSTLLLKFFYRQMPFYDKYDIDFFSTYVTEYRKLLTELEPEDLMLLGGDVSQSFFLIGPNFEYRLPILGLLRFTVTPKQHMIHHLNIHIKGFNGKEEVTYDIPLTYDFTLQEPQQPLP